MQNVDKTEFPSVDNKTALDGIYIIYNIHYYGGVIYTIIKETDVVSLIGSPTSFPETQHKLSQIMSV